MVASHVPLTGDLACNLGMCPDWESNWQPFGLQASNQSTEPHQPQLKMPNCKDKDRILKAAREKQEVTYKGALTRLAADFSTDIL